VKEFSWLPLACVLLASAAVWGRPRPAPAEGLHVKAMTFNIRYAAARDGANRWPLRRDMVLEVIRRFQGDFVGVQEALSDQVTYLRENSPEHGMIARSRLADPVQGEAVPLLYRRARWRLDQDQHGTFWFSDTPEKPASTSWGNSIPRIATWGRFVEKETGRAVYVYNVHFDHASEPSRQRSAALLARYIANREHSDPVIVTGDFNAGESSVAIRFLKGRHGVEGLPEPSPVPLVDTFRVKHPDAKAVGTFGGFKGVKTGAKIDYVLTLPAARVPQAEIVYFNRNGRYPSDHYPVSAEIILPTAEERTD
jgi:endonuclease/exonuclease/phosphatase family metal-dependent hydrolase